MFRAKTKEGKVVEGYWCVIESVHYIIPDDAHSEFHDEYDRSHDYSRWLFGGFVEIIPSTLAQDTTIKDKNGTPIYGSFKVEGVMSEGGDDVRFREDSIGDWHYRKVVYRGNEDYPAFDFEPQIDCDCNGLSYAKAECELEVIGQAEESKQ